MTFLIAFVLLLAVAALVSMPFWRQGPAYRGIDPRRAALEASRDAKYRDIRDAQMDHAAGKMSDEDFARINGELRRDAIEILDQLKRLEPEADGKA